MDEAGQSDEAIWKRCFLETLFSSVDGETMLSENGDVIKLDTTGRQTTRAWVSKMADKRYHVASLFIGFVVWTGENDTKTISVDANRFENGVKQPLFSFENELVWTGP